MKPRRDLPRRIRALVAAMLAAMGVTAPPFVSDPDPEPVLPLVMEAEEAVLSGGAVVETEHAGYTGSGYVGGFTDTNKGQAAVTFDVAGFDAGEYDLALRYANGTGVDMTLSLYVDGSWVRQLVLASPGGWASWTTVETTVELGTESQVMLRFNHADSGNVNLDQLVVDQAGSTDPDPEPVLPLVMEAEEAVLSGGAVVETEHAGYTGSGYVGGFTDTNKGQAAVTFDVAGFDAGEYDLALRYANGTGVDMTLSLYVDGSWVRQLVLASPGGWASWTTVETTVELGTESQVMLRFNHADSGNVNLDQLVVDQAGSTDPDPDPEFLDSVPAEPGLMYESTTAFLAGGAQEADGHVAGLDTPGARMVMPVWSTSSATQTVSIRYANATSTDQSLTFVVNGLRVGRIALPPTSAWSEIGYHVELPIGLGSIGLEKGTHDTGEIAIDQIGLASGAPLTDRGATVPYTTYGAESATTNAEVLGPDRTFRTVAAEATGRQAVRLAEEGDFVEFTLLEPANALVVRYSIPDSEDGAGITASLGLYADGAKVRDVELTSAFSWVYGDYPYHNDPALGGAQRFFDETRLMLAETLPPGTSLRLVKDAASEAEHYDIDLLEAEIVGESLSTPAGYVDITEHGATPDDRLDDSAAIGAAIAAAQASGAGVWIPAGRFTTAQRIDVADVSVRGAGPWHSIIEGRDGKGGFFATGSNVVIADLMIDGDVRYRDDAAFDAALEGNFGTGSLIQNVWIEHTKVGLWADHGTDGLLALGLRIRNVFADGVNLHGNVKDTVVMQSAVRNTGDDALAMWSDGAPVTNSSFAFNTVQVPLLGNGVGIYGGTSNQARDNNISDTLTGSAGIAVGTRFNPVPLSGETLIERNTLTRTGGYEPNWDTELGAVWIYADTADITAPITVRDLLIEDSTYQGLLLSWQRLIENVTFERVTIDGAGSYGIQIEATGSATFSHVTVADAALGGIDVAPGFDVVRGPGNSGF